MSFKKNVYMKVSLALIGYLICLIGVLCPWRLRNAYLNVIAIITQKLLSSEAFVSFFMDVGFATEFPIHKNITKDNKKMR